MSEDALDLVVYPQDGAAAAADYVIAAPPPRFVIIHYHILKNAGTTIEFILQREFGEDFARLHGSDPGAILTSAQGSGFLKRLPNVRAVSSHHLAYPPPHLPQTVVFDICFLRDPLQRLWSFYKYLRRSADDDELSGLARRVDLPAFLAVLIRDYPHLANDAQVNRLSNAGVYTRPPNRIDLSRAATTVLRMSVLGVVELFDESCVAAEYALSPAFPGLQMHYVRQNVSPVQPEDQRSFRKAAGKHVCEQLLQMNRLDYELLRRARSEVQRRFRLVPHGKERLREFRDRCAMAQFAQGACAAGA